MTLPEYVSRGKTLARTLTLIHLRGKKTGSVSELVRDAMLVLAYSAVHKV